MVGPIQNTPTIKESSQQICEVEDLHQEASELAQNLEKLLNNLGAALENKAKSIKASFAKAVQEAYQGLGEKVISIKKELYISLKGLSAIFEAVKPNGGLIGGPSTVHPNAFKQQLKDLEEKLKNTQAETKEEAQALKELKELMSKLMPAYEAYLGAGVYYPSSDEEAIRYRDANGNEISKEQFDQIKSDFKETLKNTTESLLNDAKERVENIVIDLIADLQEVFEATKA